MLHEDWFMRQISILIDAIINLVFKKNEPTDIFLNDVEMDQQLQSLILDKKFCEAEDLLYERMAPGDGDTLKAALKFYAELAQLSDTDLESHDFSREEIEQGISDITKAYGLDIDFLRE